MLKSGFNNLLARVRRLLSIYGFRGAARVAAQRLVLKRVIPLLAALARRELERRLRGEEAGRVVVIRSTLDMAYPYKQRVHHMALEFARQARRVVFVTPNMGHDSIALAIRGPHEMILTPHGEAALAATKKPLYLALSTDTSLRQDDVDRVLSRGGRVIYDFIDHMDDAVSSHPIPPERLALHDKLLADDANVLVLASADALMRDVAARRRHNYLLITNGVDVERFKSAARSETGLRADFARVVARGRPIFGYYGSLASWFDYALVRSLAKARPGCDVVLVGPDLDGTSAALAQPPENLFVLPAMRYEDLPRHAAWFDVCLVPFVVNDITLATSPLKIFEYMALAKPTVSTNLPECRKYSSVLTADAAHFADACDRALALKDDPELHATALRECEENSWEHKVAALLSHTWFDRASHLRVQDPSGKASTCHRE